MRVRWTIPAADDLEELTDYIRRDNPTAAREIAGAILESVSRLAAFPSLGRPGEAPGTRELVIPRFSSYVVVYRVTSHAIEVLHVWHGAQDWR